MLLQRLFILTLFCVCSNLRILSHGTRPVGSETEALGAARTDAHLHRYRAFNGGCLDFSNGGTRLQKSIVKMYFQ